MAPLALASGCSEVDAVPLGAEADLDAGIEDASVDARCNDQEFVRMWEARFGADGGIRPVCVVSPLYDDCPARLAFDYFYACRLLRP